MAIAVFIFGIGLALIIPEKIFTDYPWLRGFTDIMVDFIPSIGEFTRVSHFPEVTLLFASVMWALLPVLVGILLFILNLMHIESDFIQHVRKKNWIFIVGAFASIGIIYWITHGDLTSNIMRGPGVSADIFRSVSESRLWMGLFGTGTVLGSAVLIVIIVMWVRYFRQIYFPDR